MSSVAFDNTMMSILLNPEGQIPDDVATGKPVDGAKERAEGLIKRLEKNKRKVLLPTPAIAELLTAIGPSAQQYVNTVSRSRVFEIGSFDARCAAELALLNRDTFAENDKKNKAEPYQKIKVDRQIIAICKVAGTRVRTQLSHQMTVAAMAMVAMKVLILRSYRVATLRQSLNRQNMRSTTLRCL